MKKKGRRRRARIGSRDCLKERESGEINSGRVGHVANRTRILNNGY